MTTENVTIDDIARELGVSKTTVSRSISGKGRISETTRRRVLDLIEEKNYKPNLIARGLAQSRTYNIGWVVPGDSEMTTLFFYQKCMQGVIDAATEADYDILITTVYDHNISGLLRVLDNHKVDGVILGQTLIRDPGIRALKKSGIPFVTIGSTEEKNVIQVDHDHVTACRELSSILKMKGIRSAALIGGGEDKVVTRSRRQGFEEGMEGVHTLIHMNCKKTEEIERAVEDVLRNKVDCIICEDDRICYVVLGKLKKERIQIPADLRVASFYNSALIEEYQPAITSLEYDPRELGNTACRTLLSMIGGEKPKGRQMLGYELMLRASTL
ncbi:MAG: LacI family DNA-binding transcriptional regulator [Lachnospiraceae bacterium]|nr:LacI family DNA-binding transcriptional regulator [Lachnospiraceae bacterium]